MRRRLRRLVPWACAVAVALVATSSAQALVIADPFELDYVALGDSYSSGEGTYDYDANREARQCHRGPLAWPRIIEQRAPDFARINHRACSGQTTFRLERLELSKDLRGRIPIDPDPSVEIVTLTIGGNDVGFGDIVRDCFLSSCANVPYSRGFERELDRLYHRLVDVIYPRLEEAYPSARIVHVGYPRITPPAGTTPVRCSWLKPNEQTAGENLAYQINGTIYLATLTSERIDWVDTTNALAGHELCTDDSWLVPLRVRLGESEMGHPTAAGQTALAEAVAAGIGFPLPPQF